MVDLCAERFAARCEQASLGLMHCSRLLRLLLPRMSCYAINHLGVDTSVSMQAQRTCAGILSRAVVDMYMYVHMPVLFIAIHKDRAM
jgi:hypothetical protein